MNNKLKITAIRQLKALSYFIFSIIMYFGIMILMGMDILFILILILPLLLLTVFPAIFLHFEYIYRNKKEEYELCGDKIVRNKENNVSFYNKEDIKKVEIYASPNYFRNDLYFTAYSNYHFAKVYLVSGEILFITSLLAPGGIDKAFSLYLKEIPYRRIKRIFATTLY